MPVPMPVPSAACVARVPMNEAALGTVVPDVAAGRGTGEATEADSDGPSEGEEEKEEEEEEECKVADPDVEEDAAEDAEEGSTEASVSACESEVLEGSRGWTTRPFVAEGTRGRFPRRRLVAAAFVPTLLGTPGGLPDDEAPAIGGATKKDAFEGRKLEAVAGASLVTGLCLSPGCDALLPVLALLMWNRSGLGADDAEAPAAAAAMGARLAARDKLELSSAALCRCDSAARFAKPLFEAEAESRFAISDSNSGFSTGCCCCCCCC